jgi:membrane associated rhomboid family serine protease
MRGCPTSEALIPLAVVLAAGAVTASAALSSHLALDVSRVLAGELWRVFSGHLAHLTWRHYAVDALAYWMLFSAYAARRNTMAATCLAIVASVAVSLTVVALGLHPIYGGLSGLSCGACAGLILAMVLDEPNDVWGYAFALLFCVYLALTDSLVAGIRVAHEAHWAGALSGMAAEGIRFCWRRKPTAKSAHDLDDPGVTDKRCPAARSGKQPQRRGAWLFVSVDHERKGC